MDNNILACDYGVQQLDSLIGSGYRLDLNQGMDARLVDREIAQILSRLTWIRHIRLSCDQKSQIEPIQRTIELLREQGLTVTTVESCTGGLLAGRLVNVPGISEVLKQGFITYSNKAKRKLVGVKKTTLREEGAVSEKTAKEMAKGALLVTGADAAVAVTGIAGPDGGTEEKPVGLVYIGVVVRGQTYVKEYHFTGSRSKIRENSVAAALTLLRKGILETAEN